MKVIGIICEYNPLHLGHAEHIKRSRCAIGEDSAIVCVMSGNFVQRGDFAAFNKHARAKMALLGGADLVVELPSPYALLSAQGFAEAGVHMLNSLGFCEYISFGSEAGDVNILQEAANVIVSEKAQDIIKDWLSKGVSYATAQQKAADSVMDDYSHVFSTPNNVLGIEYIKAVKKYDSAMKPITIKRVGGEHDSDAGYSATAARKILFQNQMPSDIMPQYAIDICNEEYMSGRGFVSIKDSASETAVLSRLRMITDFSDISGFSEGLENRFAEYAKKCVNIESFAEQVKTKRYPMSRIRRTLMCAVLGIKNEHAMTQPPYIRVLGFNEIGKKLLASLRKNEELQIITKPASVYKMDKRATSLFELEARATDFYSLLYTSEEQRIGGQEWLAQPIIL